MPADDVALVRRRQARLARLRAATAATLERLWVALSAYDESQRVEWRRKAGPVVLAGQNQAIDAQIAHLGLLLGERFTFNRADLLAAATVDLDEPFIAFARALVAGRPVDEAVAAGRLRAHGLGESAVQWASRAANNAVDGDERIVGWNRTLTGLACDWCRNVARQTYRTADSASFGHQRCDCGVDPIIGDRNPGRRVNEALSA